MYQAPVLVGESCQKYGMMTLPSGDYMRTIIIMITLPSGDYGKTMPSGEYSTKRGMTPPYSG